MQNHQEWKVNEGDSGLKLLDFLKRKLDSEWSARKIKQAVESGYCHLNNKVERFASKLVGKGDTVAFSQFPLNSGKIRPTIHSTLADTARILFQDEDLLAYNKPSGISSEDRLLLETVRAFHPEAQLAHRLDKETSGILMFSLNETFHKALLDLFKSRQIQKIYLALIDGKPPNTQGVVENYLGKLVSYHGQSIWGKVSKEKGLYSLTRWELKQYGDEASLLVCYPETGRTHQIRVHLSSIGHPILGDYQYGKTFVCPFVPPRIMLHAYKASFFHPKKKVKMEVCAPIPADFLIFCEKLYLKR